jgi:hypothetical protein
LSTATINGNNVTVQGLTWDRLVSLMATDGGIDQFSVMKSSESEEPTYEISYRMRQRELTLYAGLIHRQNAENKLKKKVQPKVDSKAGKPDTSGKPDNTPPKGPNGTPPRAGGGKVVELQNTFAIAA